MGTRGAFGVVIGEQEKIGYNQFDSYPDGWGIDNLRWLRDSDLDLIREKAEKAILVSNEAGRPTEEQQEALKEWADDRVSEQSLADWYCLLRQTHGDIGKMLDAGYIEDASEFPADSLFCEWGYIVDLDANRFEVYEGFQKVPHTLGRFADRKSRSGYEPIALKASWSLNALPTDKEFLEATKRRDDEDE